jgi:molybdenum cofactor synthesis domain-containing protein
MKMRIFSSLIPVDEALRIALDATVSIDRTEILPVDEALGRVLAKDIVAEADVPPFNRSAMDGFAVRAEDTHGASPQNPKILRCRNAIYAGDLPATAVAKGECAKIATGAMIPQGANAVVMVEDTEMVEDVVKIFQAVSPGANISLSGSDIARGTKVVSEGCVLNPGKIGVLTTLGIARVEVYCKPTVAIIPTGTEVAEVGTELKKGQVYDSNSFTLAALVRENGGIPKKIEIAEDTMEGVESSLDKTLEMNSDLILFSGGSSVGERDLLVDVISKRGKVLFHGVQIKPGKPLLCGVVDGKIVLGIPGYPTSCLVIGYVFVAPILRKIARVRKREHTIKAKMAQPFKKKPGRKQVLTVRIERGEAIPVFKESGAITSISEADGYIEIPESVDFIEKGEEVEVKLF